VVLLAEDSPDGRWQQRASFPLGGRSRRLSRR
jgi:hypothetical protein